VRDPSLKGAATWEGKKTGRWPRGRSEAAEGKTAGPTGTVPHHHLSEGRTPASLETQKIETPVGGAARKV